MDTPIQRTIKIGSSTVGLIGLDVALNTISYQELSDEEASNILFDAISKHNYIPSGSENQYKQALLLEYKSRKYSKDDHQDDRLIIRILGRPCVSCNKLKTIVIDILQEMEMAADIEDVQDLDEIWRYGVTKTPALIINNTVKSAGLQPSRSQVEEWLREESSKLKAES